MDTDELAQYLDSLQREECYRVDAVMKESPREVTQRVTFIGVNGSEHGSYVRKFIKRGEGLGGAYRRLFEAQRAGRRFKHLPGILECYERGSDLVVVMEYVRGETLDDLTSRLGPSTGLARGVFPRMCDAVAELHEEFDPPIIHRDLKPSNVILGDGPEGGCTVIDFGIARDFKDGAGGDTTHFGTRAFAPPEQFGYGQTTVRSDVYALGLLLYFCLTGAVPDASEREARFRDARVPTEMRGVIAKATAFDPMMRYPSARELKEAFLAAANGKAPSGDELSGSPGDVRPGRATPGGLPADSDAQARRAVAATAPEPHPAQVAAMPDAVDAKGRGRNAFIAASVALSCLCSLWLAVNPPATSAGTAAAAPGLVYGVLTPLFLVWAGFLCLDKDRLRRRYRAFAGLRTWHVVTFSVIIWLLMFIVSGVANIAR